MDGTREMRIRRRDLHTLVMTIAIIASLLVPFSVSATIYEPGETLEPDCAPIDMNCGVTPPASSGANTDITSLQGLSMITSTHAFFVHTTSTNLVVTGLLTLPLDSIIDASVSDALTIDGGMINNTPIGSVTPSTAVFTNVTSTNGFIDALAFTTITGGSVTSTNGNFSNFSFVNLSGMSATTTNLSFGNAVGTGVTTTNAFFENAGITALVLGGESINDFTGNGLTVFGGALQLAASYLDGSTYDSRFVNVAGDTMTGPLTVPSSTIGILTVTSTLNLSTNSISDAFVVNALTVDGGSIENTPIGISIPTSARFTTVSSSDLGIVGTLSISSSSLSDGIRQRFITDDLFGDYTVTQDSFDNGFGSDRKNQSLRIGFNKNRGGERLIPSSASMGIDFESYFMQGSNDPAMELHLPSIVDTDGIERRPISLEYHLISGTSTPGIANLMFNAQGISFGNTTGTQYAHLSPTEFTFNSTGIRQNTNNINWLRQMNNAGNGTIEIARVNNLDQVLISESGADTVIASNLGIGTNAIGARLSLGASSTAQGGGILFEGDTNLYREQADVLATDDFFTMNQPNTSGGGLAITYGSSRAALRLAGGSGDIVVFGCTTASCTRMQIGAGGGNQALGSSMDFWSYGHIVFNTVGGGENARFEPNGDFLIATTTDYAKFTVDGSAYLSGAVRIATTTAVAGLTVGTTSYFNGAMMFVSASGTQVTSTNLAISGSYLQTPRSNPTIEGNISFSAPEKIEIAGKYAYVTNSSLNRFGIIDISDPNEPVEISTLSSSTAFSFVKGLDIAGKYAYVSGLETFQIIDISNPTSPTIIGGVTSTDIYLDAVYVSGNYAYVSGIDSVQIINISNPTSPVIVGSVVSSTALGSVTSLYVSGVYAYVADRSSDSLRIVDVSNPASPVIVGSVVSSTALNDPWSVYVSGKHAYLANETDDSLRIIDVSDPTSPVIVGGVKNASLLDGARSVYVSGKYAYVGVSSDNSLRIIDVSDPTSPVIVGGIKNGSLLYGVRSVYVSGKYAYTANWAGNSISIIDLGGIDAPVANMGMLEVSSVNVTDNFNVANNASITNGLNVGGSIKIDNGLSVSASDVFMPGLDAPSSTSDMLCLQPDGRVTHQASNCTVSSQRFKHDIEDWSNGLEEVLAFRTVKYKRNSDNVEELGLIAEEVNQIDPHYVIFEPGNSTTPRSLDYERFVVPLISAVQSQQQQIDGLLLASIGVSSTTLHATSEEELLYAANRPLTSALEYLINKITESAIIIKDFVAERITAVVGVFHKVKTGVIEVDDGMEIKDSSTGQVYCVKIIDGQLTNVLGTCTADVIDTTTNVDTTTNTDQLQDTVSNILSDILFGNDTTSTAINSSSATN